MFNPITFIIIIILMAVEYLLCTKFRSPLWGGIIPLSTLAVSLFFFISKSISVSWDNVLLFVLLNLFVWGFWVSGRVSYQKKQALELDKMKAKDMIN